MVKLLSFLRCRPPSWPGYPDPATLYDIDQVILEIVNGRSTCNATNPNIPIPGNVWDLSYTTIAPGIYDAVYQYDDSTPSRLCFVLNGGLEVPTVLPAFLHGWRSVASSVECHCGETDIWPGSKACLTIQTSQWPRITQHFTVGEKLKIEVKTFNG